MNTWGQAAPFESINIEHAQRFCMEQYAPDVVYAPLQQWLQNPKLKHGSPSATTHEENLRLRSELNAIYASKTWRWGSKVHSWIQQLSPSRRQ